MSTKRKNKTSSNKTPITILSISCVLLAGLTIYLYFNQKTSDEKRYLEMIPWALAHEALETCQSSSSQNQTIAICQPSSHGVSANGDPYIIFTRQEYVLSSDSRGQLPAANSSEQRKYTFINSGYENAIYSGYPNYGITEERL
ncbi:hypothetical protein IJ095_03400 [Candidatus Saccharibacteria bacterium]|nr:hypothetical protein [Candidatus Saccharibacteria bacterium]